jgi:hypothetical protein
MSWEVMLAVAWCQIVDGGGGQNRKNNQPQLRNNTVSYSLLSVVCMERLASVPLLGDDKSGEGKSRFPVLKDFRNLIPP